MKIAQVSPLFESVPPRLYGGTERVVSYLTEELVKKGHVVTLFASGDSLTQARLISGTQKALRLDTACRDQLCHQMLHMQNVLDHAHEFDIIHFHTDYFHFAFSSFMPTPNVTTLHGRLDFPHLQTLYARYGHIPVVSISKRQRLPLLNTANWVGNVYHGLPLDLYKPNFNKKNYLVFLGRVSRDKRLDLAIEIALKAKIPLKIAAKIDKADKEHFGSVIQPLLKQAGIEFLGEVGDRDKEVLLGEAKALLFPIDWPEPFGMVMIEAMACATPVIAYPNGSVPEVVDDGVSGFVVNSVEEAVYAIKKLDQLNPADIRACFEERFDVSRMADEYIDVYERLVDFHRELQTEPASGAYRSSDSTAL
jgi:glycosyltransferase involved in cell wall biosynthesis